MGGRGWRRTARIGRVTDSFATSSRSSDTIAARAGSGVAESMRLTTRTGRWAPRTPTPTNADARPAAAEGPALPHPAPPPGRGPADLVESILLGLTEIRPRHHRASDSHFAD